MSELSLPLELWADAGDDTEALLEGWHVAAGAAVAAGQVLATAVIVKTTVELVAPAAGVLEAILVPAGETFARGVPLARLREATAGASPAPAAPPEPAPAPAAAPRATGAPAPIPFTGMRGSIARNLTAAWQAPRVAMGLEVDLTATMASLAAMRAEPNGPRPTLTALVVRAAALALRAHPRVNATVSESGIEPAAGVHIAVAVSLDDGLVTPVVRDADTKSVAAIAAEIAELAAAARAGSLGPGSAQGGTFTVSNLGASGIDWFTPVLNPPQAAILGVGRVAERPVARAGSLGPGSAQGGTFTVSNLGASGIDWFTPVLNAPQAAILGVGRVAERPVARAGSLAVAPCVTLTLVFDHRALDGEPAAHFLAELGRLLASLAG